MHSPHITDTTRRYCSSAPILKWSISMKSPNWNFVNNLFKFSGHFENTLRMRIADIEPAYWRKWRHLKQIWTTGSRDRTWILINGRITNQVLYIRLLLLYFSRTVFDVKTVNIICFCFVHSVWNRSCVRRIFVWNRLIWSAYRPWQQEVANKPPAVACTSAPHHSLLHEWRCDDTETPLNLRRYMCMFIALV